MRIAIVSGDDVVDGDPQQLCAALFARGVEASVYVRQSDTRAAHSPESYPTVPICVGPRRPATASEVLPYVGEWSASLQRHWLVDPPDIVHAYGWLGGLAAQLAARRQRLPIVQTFAGLAATSRYGTADGAHLESERERLEPLLVRGATWVTGESADDVDTLSRLRRGRTRVSALTGGVDIERYSSVGPSTPRGNLHRILCVTPSLSARHGSDIVIGALPRVSGAELIIAETQPTNSGHDEARSALRRLATGLGVANRVRFAGTVDEDRLPMLLRSADVVACTPREPPRVTGALQAMACGVLVVALPVGVLNDVVVDDVTGLLVSPGTPAALAAALRNALAQSFERESMGASGRSRAVSRFTWDRVALDAINVYRQVEGLTLLNSPVDGGAVMR